MEVAVIASISTPVRPVSDALAVARANAEHLGAAVQFLHGDWFNPCAGQRYALVVSNPPYIPSAVCKGLDPVVRDHEPWLALDGGLDGLAPRGAVVEQVIVLDELIGLGKGDELEVLAVPDGLDEHEDPPEHEGADGGGRERWAAAPGLPRFVFEHHRRNQDLDMAYVACGRVDAYAENDIMYWDIAAGAALALLLAR